MWSSWESTNASPSSPITVPAKGDPPMVFSWHCVIPLESAHFLSPSVFYLIVTCFSNPCWTLPRRQADVSTSRRPWWALTSMVQIGIRRSALILSQAWIFSSCAVALRGVKEKGSQCHPSSNLKTCHWNPPLQLKTGVTGPWRFGSSGLV